GLLPPDRARPDADLFPRRAGQSRARRVLCAGRVLRDQARRHARFRRRAGRIAAGRGADRPGRRAAAVSPLLSRGSGARLAPDVRPGAGRRAGLALDIRRGADSVFDSAGAERPDLRRRLHLFEVPAADARDRGRRRRRLVAAAAANAVRKSRSRRRAESRHGGGARDFAFAVHGQRGRAGSRTGGARGRASGADLRGSSGDGNRYSDGVLRRRRHRRAGLVLGRRLGGVDRRRRARADRVFLSPGGRSVDVPADGAGAAVPAARLVRRADPALRMKLRSPLAIAGLVCAILPFALLAGGLTLTSATDVVIFAIACMALNILVGHTGLVSFGHGAWFGLGAYAAALAQRHWFPGSVLWPALFALGFLLVASVLVGFLVLRRRGVYFSLLTLAFSALTYAVAFRWTSFTGGENGLGGVTRAVWLGVDLENPWIYYALVAGLGLLVVHALARFHASPIGSVLLAIRENEQRAQFIGYATQRYKQIAYAASATLTGFAGVLFAFHH